MCVCVCVCVFTYVDPPPPADSQDPAAGTVSGGASGQRLIRSAQPGGRLGHRYTSERHAQIP